MDGSEMREVAQRLEQAGQGHLVLHAAGLPETEAAVFLREAAALPWQELGTAFQATPAESQRELRPPQTLSLKRQSGQGPLRTRIARLGMGLLAGGRVATLLLAGGQGTRLGHAGPKGDVVFGPEPDRTLYRIQAERVAAVSKRVGHPIPLYVLVSPETEAATRRAFESAGDWGLGEGQVRILVQGTLPALDAEGRALLAAPGQLARAPDGHGGAFHALVDSGALAELQQAGVDVLTTFQVDNPLARPLDPIMLGWMVERRLEATGKAVCKATPDEKVGIYARDLAGRTRVVEYTELPVSEEQAPASPSEPQEAPLDMGSIAIHGFAVSFLKRLADQGFRLPLHRAHKKVSHLDSAGAAVQPDEPNAWKLERFIFDLFPHAARCEVHEVERAWEFAPVKNAAGVDSLESARAMVEAEVRRWHEAHGMGTPEVASLRPLEVDGGREAI